MEIIFRRPGEFIDRLNRTSDLGFRDAGEYLVSQIVWAMPFIQQQRAGFRQGNGGLVQVLQSTQAVFLAELLGFASDVGNKQVKHIKRIIEGGSLIGVGEGYKACDTPIFRHPRNLISGNLGSVAREIFQTHGRNARDVDVVNAKLAKFFIAVNLKSSVDPARLLTPASRHPL
jgi:hypothetical protein